MYGGTDKAGKEYAKRDYKREEIVAGRSFSEIKTDI